MQANIYAFMGNLIVHEPLTTNIILISRSVQEHGKWNMNRDLFGLLNVSTSIHLFEAKLFK